VPVNILLLLFYKSVSVLSLRNKTQNLTKK